MHRLLLVLPILAAAGSVYADPCGDARAERGAKDYARASIDAAACGDDALIADVDRRAEKAGFSPVEVITEPDGGTVIVEPAPDRPFRAPLRVWLPPGRHFVTAQVDGQPVAQTVVVAQDGDRTSAYLTLPPPPDPSTTGVVDMGDEGGGEMTSGPPPKVVMPSLLPERYQQGVDAQEAWTEHWPPVHRERWRVAIGLVSGFHGSFGGEVAVAHRIRAWDRDQSWVPGVSLAALSMPDLDERGFTVALTADVLYEFRFAAPHRMQLSVGAGPALSYATGVDAFTGATAAGVAAVGLTHRDMTAMLRLDTPVWSSADDRILTVTALAGHRW